MMVFRSRWKEEERRTKTQELLNLRERFQVWCNRQFPGYKREFLPKFWKFLPPSENNSSEPRKSTGERFLMKFDFLLVQNRMQKNLSPWIYIFKRFWSNENPNFITIVLPVDLPVLKEILQNFSKTKIS